MLELVGEPFSIKRSWLVDLEIGAIDGDQTDGAIPLPEPILPLDLSIARPKHNNNGTSI